MLHLFSPLTPVFKRVTNSSDKHIWYALRIYKQATSEMGLDQHHCTLNSTTQQFSAIASMWWWRFWLKAGIMQTSPKCTGMCARLRQSLHSLTSFPEAPNSHSPWTPATLFCQEPNFSSPRARWAGIWPHMTPQTTDVISQPFLPSWQNVPFKGDMDHKRKLLYDH